MEEKTLDAEGITTGDQHCGWDGEEDSRSPGNSLVWVEGVSRRSHWSIRGSITPTRKSHDYDH